MASNARPETSLTTQGMIRAHASAKAIMTIRSKALTEQPSLATTLNEKGDCVSTIEFREVQFTYPSRPEVEVLSRLSFAVRPGAHVAFVGPSGSGKSSIIKLIERFYSISSGQILVKGTSIADIDVKAYRASISVVSQETSIFKGTVKENILLGVPHDQAISEGVLIQACRDANIHDFIMSLPDGYNSDCGNKGLTFSGGQRQRLAIARALIRSPSILLLDEATSALDAENEQVVLDALNKASVKRTTISVAHRLSTIQKADWIFVLADGSICEQGSHNELLEKRGVYFGMCQGQSVL